MADYHLRVDEHGSGEPEIGEEAWEAEQEGKKILREEMLREELEKQGFSEEDIAKVIKFKENSAQHAENERLAAEFDEQRLADLNALAEEKGLATEDASETENVWE
jgi:ribosome-binding protein aMBF1 (putative translation factor)